MNGEQITQEESVKIFDLVVRDGSLPESLDKLVPLSFIGNTAVQFYRAKVKLMDQLGMTEEQRAATLHDGQDAGKLLLEIEARIGELSLRAPQLHAPGAGRGARPTGEPPKYERLGIGSKRRMDSAQTIHRNPEAVAAVIKEAEKNDDIPTKTAVLNRVRFEREQRRRKEQDNQAREKPDIEKAQDDVAGAITALGIASASIDKLVQRLRAIGVTDLSGPQVAELWLEIGRIERAIGRLGNYRNGGNDE